MKTAETGRKYGFDFLRIICAFLIICIHTQHVYDYAVVIARAAVPVFFMITGFFYSSVLQRGRRKAQIHKILRLMLLANGFYLIWSMVTDFTGLRVLLNGSVWIRCLLWNVSPFESHLWYLSALLYVLLIAGVLDTLRIRKKVYWLIPVLLGMNLVLGNYSGLIFEKNPLLAHSRNFLFVGLPCFLLGDLLYQRREAKKVPNQLLWLMLEVSIVGALIEYELMIRTPRFVNRDFFLCTIVTSYAVFTLVRNNPQWFDHPLMRKISRMGKELSLGIYVFHAAILTVVEKLIQILLAGNPAVDMVCSYGMPVIMLVIDSLAVFSYLWIVKRVKTWCGAKRAGSESSC